jgi:hypothetical protein
MNLNILNNREWAIAIWLLVLLCFVFYKKEISRPLGGALKMLFSGTIGLSILGMLIYICAAVWLLYKVGFWNTSMMKDTIVWTVTIAVIILANSMTKAVKEDNYFKHIIVETIKITILIEFLVNLYVFNFWIEFFLVPVSALIGGMIAVATHKPEYKPVLGFLNSLVAIFGFICIAYSLYHIFARFADFATLQNLEGFLLPILLTFLFLPYAYIMSLWSAYEQLFLKTNDAYRHNPSMAKYARRIVLIRANLRLKRIRMFTTDLHVYDIETRTELNEAISKLNFGGVGPR